MLLENDNTQENKNQFNILLTGYEGPIDLLLDLARKQKVNLSDISILELAEQYIKFINNYNKIHLEIAADYLVMAAWLTYLKSRLLLPKDETTEDFAPEDIEEALRYQLQRLEMIQNISKKLYDRPLINRDIFYGGSIEGVNIKYNITYKASLFDILNTYSNLINKGNQATRLSIALSELYSVDHAIQRIKGIFGTITEWTNFMNLIPQFGTNKIINNLLTTLNFKQIKLHKLLYELIEIRFEKSMTKTFQDNNYSHDKSKMKQNKVIIRNFPQRTQYMKRTFKKDIKKLLEYKKELIQQSKKTEIFSKINVSKNIMAK